MRWKRYKITRETFDQLTQQQQNRCASCLDPFLLVPHVDHCHKTGQIRGLLCMRCNRALGLLNDDVNRVKQLFTYRSQH